MNIGNLLPLTDKPDGEYTGRIETLQLDLNVCLEPSTRSGHPDAPTHRVHARNLQGNYIEIGAAWRKSIQRGDRAGEPFFSLTLDDPSLPHALSVAAFKNRDDSGFTVSWRRRQGGNTEATDG